MYLNNDPLLPLQTDAVDEPPLWELFHENTKQGRYDIPMPTESIIQIMSHLAEALDYGQLPKVELPPPDKLDSLAVPMGETIQNRESCRDFLPEAMALGDLATLLHYSCGANRDNEGTGFNRWFRNYPSGGALYPLEIYIHASRIDGLATGIYHYHPVEHQLRQLGDESSTRAMLKSVVQADVVENAAVVVMMTAIFERSIFKYGQRGYRLALLEAGHVAQNMNLVAESMGLGCLNIAGYYDREVDELLGINGIDQSTVYLACAGPKQPS